MALRLVSRRVEKVWGRRDLGPWFEDVPEGGEPVGEIWYQMPDGRDSEMPLLVKVLFTSERLSVQVHPDDALAQKRGLPRGKDEAWVILDAEPEGCLGLGMREAVSKEELRASALDGSIVGLMHWQMVRPGDCYFSPSGTIHAIGAGLTLVEVQQNSDTTYRLYDYGRPRELHLEEAVEAADPVPWVSGAPPEQRDGCRTVLVDGPSFVLERWRDAGSGTLRVATGRPCWLVVLEGGGTIDGAPAAAGECWLAEEPAQLSFGQPSDLLIAYPGTGVAAELWRPAGTAERRAAIGLDAA